jgi:hypothetical protein
MAYPNPYTMYNMMGMPTSPITNFPTGMPAFFN